MGEFRRQEMEIEHILMEEKNQKGRSSSKSDILSPNDQSNNYSSTSKLRNSPRMIGNNGQKANP